MCLSTYYGSKHGYVCVSILFAHVYTQRSSVRACCIRVCPVSIHRPLVSQNLIIFYLRISKFKHRAMSLGFQNTLANTLCNIWLQWVSAHLQIQTVICTATVIDRYKLAPCTLSSDDTCISNDVIMLSHEFNQDWCSCGIQKQNEHIY